MDCDSLVLKLPSYFSSCKILDLAVTQTNNKLKSWFNVYFDKYCHKSIQKFKTVTENKRNLDFLFEFRAIFSFCSADILFFTPHLSLETLETKAQPTHNIPSFQWPTGKQLSSKTIEKFRFGHLQFLKESDVHDYPQQPECWLQPIIGPRLWS